VRDDNRPGQLRAHPDAARHDDWLDTQVRHFLFGAVACLGCGVVATTRVALLVAAHGFAPLYATPSGPADITAVDLPVVAATTDIEDFHALAAPRFSKAVSCFLAVLDDALDLELAWISTWLRRKEPTMSRPKPRNPKARKPFQPRKSLKTEAEKLDELAHKTARVFASSYETAEDEQRLLDVDADLNFRRVPHEIWRERSGPGQPLAAAMADLIVENERHRQVLAEFFQRFEAIAAQTAHESLAEPESYFELVRTRLFPDDPA
jgi:hypothetical protein